MANRDVLAIGASAGGVEALVFLAKQFPADFPASVLVTLHLSKEFRSPLDHILDRAGSLKAQFASNGQQLRKATIYIAPPNKHLLLDGDHLQLGNGPRENYFRPAIDPMLRSVALCCGGRAIEVILTGTMGDGASGLWAVGQSNGVTVIQDPNDAQFSAMPEAALSRITPDHLVGLSNMPKLFESLVHEPAVENLGRHGDATMWLQRVHEYDRELAVITDAIQTVEDIAAKAQLESSGGSSVARP